MAHETVERIEPPLRATETDLAREYDTLRVRLIVLNYARRKDKHAINAVNGRLAELRAALKATLGLNTRMDFLFEG